MPQSMNDRVRRSIRQMQLGYVYTDYIPMKVIQLSMSCS